MRVAEYRSWRQLISQGEHAQKIIVRIKGEEQSRQDQPEQSDQAQSSLSEGKDTTATKANPLQ